MAKNRSGAQGKSDRQLALLESIDRSLGLIAQWLGEAVQMQRRTQGREGRQPKIVRIGTATYSRDEQTEESALRIGNTYGSTLGPGARKRQAGGTPDVPGFRRG